MSFGRLVLLTTHGKRNLLITICICVISGIFIYSGIQNRSKVKDFSGPRQTIPLQLRQISPNNFLQKGELPKSDFNGIDVTGNKDCVSESLREMAASKDSQGKEVLSKIVYIKIGKTGSTTIHQLLFSYGYRHRLPMLMPKVIGGGYNSRDLEPGVSWDIAPNRDRPPCLTTAHARYNRLLLDKYFANNTAYITSIRDPRTWFISFVDFHNRLKKRKITPREMLNSDELFFAPRKHIYQLDRMVHNFLLQWLGFELPPNYKYDEKAILDYIQLIDKRFHLVMLAEYPDESLILLRRLLSLSMNDIFYTRLNEASYKSHTVFTKEEKLKLIDARHNRGDWLLYQHFNRTFWKKISEETEFYGELDSFRRLHKLAFDFCQSEEVKKDQSKTLHLSTKWEENIIINSARCLTLLGSFSGLKHYAPFVGTVSGSVLNAAANARLPWPGLI